jgi:hypothetical protein
MGSSSQPRHRDFEPIVDNIDDEVRSVRQLPWPGPRALCNSPCGFFKICGKVRTSSRTSPTAPLKKRGPP